MGDECALHHRRGEHGSRKEESRVDASRTEEIGSLLDDADDANERPHDRRGKREQDADVAQECVHLKEPMPE